MQYKLTHSANIIRVDDGATIPADPSNNDFVQYQQWLAAGNTPLAADPAPVPTQQEQIDAYVLLHSGGMIPNEIQLEGLMAGLLGGAVAQGYTEAQLLAGNAAYKIGSGIRTAIAAFRANGVWP